MLACCLEDAGALVGALELPAPAADDAPELELGAAVDEEAALDAPPPTTPAPVAPLEAADEAPEEAAELADVGVGTAKKVDPLTSVRAVLVAAASVVVPATLGMTSTVVPLKSTVETAVKDGSVEVVVMLTGVGRTRKVDPLTSDRAVLDAAESVVVPATLGMTSTLVPLTSAVETAVADGSTEVEPMGMIAIPPVPLAELALETTELAAEEAAELAADTMEEEESLAAAEEEAAPVGTTKNEVPLMSVTPVLEAAGSVVVPATEGMTRMLVPLIALVETAVAEGSTEVEPSPEPPTTTIPSLVEVAAMEEEVAVAADDEEAPVAPGTTRKDVPLMSATDVAVALASVDVPATLGMTRIEVPEISAVEIPVAEGSTEVDATPPATTLATEDATLEATLETSTPLLVVVAVTVVVAAAEAALLAPAPEVAVAAPGTTKKLVPLMSAMDVPVAAESVDVPATEGMTRMLVPLISAVDRPVADGSTEVDATPPATLEATEDATLEAMELTLTPVAALEAEAAAEGRTR